MTQIELVQQSYKAVLHNVPTFARDFYRNLFAMDPSLQVLFNGNMEEQERKLIQALSVVVNSLGNMGPIESAVRKLGIRHLTYGVTPSDYNTVGAALIAALRQALKDDFTEATEFAWIAVYRSLSRIMIGASIDTEWIADESTQENA